MMKTSETNSLPDELREKIERYAAEELLPEEIQDLWSELVGNEEALDYLKTVVNLRKIAEEEQKRISGRGVTERSLSPAWAWTAAAAALVLLVMAGLFRPGGEFEPAEPLVRIELDYYRSSDEQPDLSDEERIIREAITLANRGDSDLAVELIDSTLGVARSPSEQARLHLNAGSILYNMSRFEAAADRFRVIVSLDPDEPAVLERAYWYLGNAYFQMNRYKEAKQAFQKTYELNGAYKRVAERYLKSLPA